LPAAPLTPGQQHRGKLERSPASKLLISIRNCRHQINNGTLAGFVFAQELPQQIISSADGRFNRFPV
jgi:hypothetical protein